MVHNSCLDVRINKSRFAGVLYVEFRFAERLGLGLKVVLDEVLLNGPSPGPLLCHFLRS